jgi:hypothetical protein
VLDQPLPGTTVGVISPSVAFAPRTVDGEPHRHVRRERIEKRIQSQGLVEGPLYLFCVIGTALDFTMHFVIRIA